MHERAKAVEPAKDFLDDLPILVRAQMLAQHLNRAAHGRQRVLHFVREHGRQFADSNETRLVAQPVLQADPFGQVADDSGEHPLAADRELADRQMRRETCCRPCGGQ